MMVDEKGNLLVIHDDNPITNVGRADIFDKDGKFIGHFSHPNRGMDKLTFKNGHAYTIETVDDEKQLVRYKAELVPVK